MALAATTLWEMNASATANMLNGGGFNTANANFLTNFTATSATGNSPVISSASYTFVAGDVGAWIYVSAGTNWTPGFYKISSVSAGAATVNATIGAAVQYNTSAKTWLPNTVAGCATVASPTSGTCGVDYSQGTTTILTKTDLACTTPSTTITSATATFTNVMVGNIMHITAITGAGTLVGWYEIVSFVSATSVVLDRTPAPSANGTAGTYYVGGALDLAGSLCDSYFESLIGGNQVFWANGTFTQGSAISVASTSATAQTMIRHNGYNTVRGDLTVLAASASKANKPTIAAGAQTHTNGQYHRFDHIKWTTTTSTGIGFGTGGQTRFCHLLNSSTTANRPALNQSGSDGYHLGTEAISQNGQAISVTGNNTKIIGCYGHDSDIGVSYSTSRGVIAFCVLKSNKTAQLSLAASGATCMVMNNTCYGSQAKVGTGILIAASAVTNQILNNIVYGCTSGIEQTTAAQDSNQLGYNLLYNNTTNYTLVTPCTCDITTTDPAFTNATELSGSTATISTNTLTQTGAFANVTDNQDYLRVVSGTGATAGIYLITSHTTDTVTVNNSIGTSAVADKVWVIPNNHNMLPTGSV